MYVCMYVCMYVRIYVIVIVCADEDPPSINVFSAL